MVERDSYDAWGKRRNPDGTDVTTCSITSGTTRGFTNQEMIDSVCLANLNARLYDPTLGRLLVADPLVPHPFRGQSFNRYAYVENGPLSATDPSGYDDVETVTVTAQNVPSNSDLLYLQHLSASALQTSLPVVEAYRSVASGGMVYSGKASASGLARVLNTADAPRDTVKPVNDDTSDNSDPTQGDFYIYGTAGAQPFWCNGQCEWTPTDVGGYWQTSMAGATGSIEEVDVIASRSTSGTNGTGCPECVQVAANGYNVSLALHEQMGGHTIKRHVNKSFDYLKGRLLSGDAETASSFTSLAAAQKLVNTVLSAQEQLIEPNKKGIGILYGHFNSPTGYMVTSTRQNAPLPTYGVMVVVAKPAATPEGFLVYTSFPTPQ